MNMLTRRNNAEMGITPAEDAMQEMFRLMLGNFPEFSATIAHDTITGMKVAVKDNEVNVTLPFPGCKAKDFQVEVVGDFLTVHAKKSFDANNNGKHFITRERSRQEFEESVKLPVRVVASETKAKYENGVLLLTLPRESVQKPQSHTIQVM